MTSLLILLASGPSIAAERVVYPTGDGDYPTIYSAIAASGPGDIVTLSAGSYYENIYVLSNAITIRGQSGATQTFLYPGALSAGSDTAVVEVLNADVVMTGITIDAGFTRRSLVAGQNSVVTLESMTLANGTNAFDAVWPGGNIDLHTGASLILLSSTVRDGIATTGSAAWGGNIAIESGTSAELDGSTVVGGNAARGGGLHVAGGGQALLRNSVLSANIASGAGDNDGGGVCAEDYAVLEVSNSVFDSNTAGADLQSGGGAVYIGNTLGLVSDSSVVFGSAHMGAGISTEGGALVAWHNLFLGNVADKGAAITCIGSDFCGGSFNEMLDNAGAQGGALYAYDSRVELGGNLFCGNRAEDNSGGVAAASGGALLLSSSSLDAYQNLFGANVAQDSGGALAAHDSFVSSRNNSWLDNHSEFGGGGSMYATDWLGLAPSFESVNDLIAYSVATWSGGVLLDPSLPSSIEYGWLWANSPDHGSIGASGTLYVDVQEPMLQSWTSGGPCDYDAIGPAAGSPLVDAGDPTRFDADGSISDIGAHGGTLEWPGSVSDEDGDGIIVMFDCDDTNASVGLSERWHPDLDGDGAGDMYTWVDQCSQPAGWTLDGSDCDDSNPGLNPYTWWFYDEDGDGFGGQAAWQSCLWPTGLVDNDLDCNDLDPAVQGPMEFHLDGDGDGYGAAVSIVGCDLPGSGWATIDGDCDDEDASVYPAAPELCDGWDQDCDGDVDEDAIDRLKGFVDGDGDGYGSPDEIETCDPLAVVEDGTDCDDTDPAVFPGAEDAPYDGVDSDCDGRNDFDLDRDGFSLDVDCDDTDDQVHPGAEEAFDDGVDNDCDGVEGRTWLGGGTGCACDAGSLKGTGPLGVIALVSLAVRRRH